MVTKIIEKYQHLIKCLEKKRKGKKKKKVTPRALRSRAKKMTRSRFAEKEVPEVYA